MFIGSESVIREIDLAVTFFFCDSRASINHGIEGLQSLVNRWRTQGGADCHSPTLVLSDVVTGSVGIHQRESKKNSTTISDLSDDWRNARSLVISHLP